MAQTTPGFALLASLPILWLVLGIGGLRMVAYRACLIGLVLSLGLACFFWDMGPVLLGRAVADGAAFALFPILFVILAAFFTYNLSIHTNAIAHIKALLAGISTDRRVQALLIAWGFGGFMEGVAGFGTAVAVPAAMLLALGFPPFTAAILCLLANTVAVPFGVIGLPISTLAQVSELPVSAVSFTVACQLAPLVLAGPVLIVLSLTRSFRKMWQVWPYVLGSGLSFAVVQLLTVYYMGPELAAILGSLASIGTIVALVKYLPVQEEWRFNKDPALQQKRQSPGSLRITEQLRAWSPYLILLLLALGTSRVFPLIHETLSAIKSTWLIYNGPGGKPHVVYWLLTPGSLVLISGFLGGLIQQASCRDMGRQFARTFCQLSLTGVTILSIVAMAKVLSYSGMIQTIAIAIADGTGRIYPLFAPFLGGLGTFVTGSDTSSALLFGMLQKEVALRLGLDPVWIVAANSSGACIGKLVSPQSIAIAAIAVQLAGHEGRILASAIRYAIPLLLFVGILIFSLAS